MSKKNKKQNQIISAIIGVIVLLSLAIFGASEDTLKAVSDITGINIENIITQENTNQDIIANGGDLKVYFIDVGQADSILVMNDNQSMLIDAGNNEDGEDVVNFIKDKGISKLDYVIGTHPHEDHIGGLDDVINNFDIEKIYMPKIETTTKTFEDVLDAVSEKNMKITSPEEGDVFQVGTATCEIMTESILEKNSLNLSSIVIRMTFGNNSFLFMGDAETENEKTRNWPKTQVLKVGHHGSNTSSSKDFLEQVSPEYAIVMVGKDNSYNLPKDEILERIRNIGAQIYRTDENGTIEIIASGNEINVNKEK